MTVRANQLAEQESEIVAYMNTEHAHNLRNFFRHQRQARASEVVVAGIDCDGFDVRADGEALRFDFESEVKDANEARTELVKLAHASHA